MEIYGLPTHADVFATLVN